MNVVSVMAHQDDELLCLGTMLKMRARGDKLHFICLTGGEMGMVHRPDMSLKEAAQIRYTEMSELARKIGATYTCLGYEDEFLYDSKAVRLALIEAMRKTQAEVIFTHYCVDYNLDHMTVNALVRQCAMQMSFPMIKTTSPPSATTPAIFQIEPSVGFEFEPTHWVDISDVVDEKCALAACHQSQDDAFKAAYGNSFGIAEWMLKTSARRGEQCGGAHGEAFRPLMTRGFVKGQSILP